MARLTQEQFDAALMAEQMIFNHYMATRRYSDAAQILILRAIRHKAIPE